MTNQRARAAAAIARTAAAVAKKTAMTWPRGSRYRRDVTGRAWGRAGKHRDAVGAVGVRGGHSTAVPLRPNGWAARRCAWGRAGSWYVKTRRSGPAAGGTAPPPAPTRTPALGACSRYPAAPPIRDRPAPPTPSQRAALRTDHRGDRHGRIHHRVGQGLGTGGQGRGRGASDTALHGPVAPGGRAGRTGNAAFRELCDCGDQSELALCRPPPTPHPLLLSRLRATTVLSPMSPRPARPVTCGASARLRQRLVRRPPPVLRAVPTPAPRPRPGVARRWPRCL